MAVNLEIFLGPLHKEIAKREAQRQNMETRLQRYVGIFHVPDVELRITRAHQPHRATFKPISPTTYLQQKEAISMQLHQAGIETSTLDIPRTTVQTPLALVKPSIA